MEAYPDFGEGDQIHEGHHPTNDGLGSSKLGPGRLATSLFTHKKYMLPVIRANAVSVGVEGLRDIESLTVPHQEHMQW